GAAAASATAAMRAPHVTTSWPSHETAPRTIRRLELPHRPVQAHRNRCRTHGAVRSPGGVGKRSRGCRRSVTSGPGGAALPRRGAADRGAAGLASPPVPLLAHVDSLHPSLRNLPCSLCTRPTACIRPPTLEPCAARRVKSRHATVGHNRECSQAGPLVTICWL